MSCPDQWCYIEKYAECFHKTSFECTKYLPDPTPPPGPGTVLGPSPDALGDSEEIARPEEEEEEEEDDRASDSDAPASALVVEPAAGERESNAAVVQVQSSPRVSAVRSGLAVEFDDVAADDVPLDDDPEFERRFCDAVEEHLNTTIYLSSVYTIDDVDCYRFDYEPDSDSSNSSRSPLRRRRRRRRLGEEGTTTGRLRTDVVTEARYSWRSVEEEIQRREDFGRLGEDSINRDGGAHLKRKLEDRRITAVKDSEVVAFETIAPVSVPLPAELPVAPAPVTARTKQFSLIEFTSTTAGLALIASISVIALLVSGLLFYKGTKRQGGGGGSEPEKGDAAILELPNCYDSRRTRNLWLDCDDDDDDANKSNATFRESRSVSDRSVPRNLVEEALRDMEGDVPPRRGRPVERRRSPSAGDARGANSAKMESEASEEELARRDEFHERLNAFEERVRAKGMPEAPDEDAARNNTPEEMIMAKSRQMAQDENDEAANDASRERMLEFEERIRAKSGASNNNGVRKNTNEDKILAKSRQMALDAIAEQEDTSHERMLAFEERIRGKGGASNNNGVRKNTSEEKILAKSRRMSLDMNAERKDASRERMVAFEKRIQTKSNAARKDTFERKILAKSRKMKLEAVDENQAWKSTSDESMPAFDRRKRAKGGSTAPGKNAARKNRSKEKMPAKSRKMESGEVDKNKGWKSKSDDSILAFDKRIQTKSRQIALDKDAARKNTIDRKILAKSKQVELEDAARKIAFDDRISTFHERIQRKSVGSDPPEESGAGRRGAASKLISSEGTPSTASPDPPSSVGRPRRKAGRRARGPVRSEREKSRASSPPRRPEPPPSALEGR